MTVQTFSKQEFEQVLVRAAREHLSEREGSRISYQGLQFNEHTYAVLIGESGKAIWVRSSVKASGVSAEAGKDSIRLWISYLNDRREWVPMGKESYTQRTEGWDDRFVEKFGALVATAGLTPAPKIESGESTELESESPSCPKCGAEMVLRTARKGQNAGSQFWGCSDFPKCRGTRNVEQAESTERAEKKEIKWSEYQRAIFTEIEHGTGNLVIEAVAGSGKTTTIVHGLEYTPKDAKVAFVAFNTHIAKELSRRAPEHVSVSTLHSLGLSNIRAALGRVKVEPNKVQDLIANLAEKLPTDGYEIVMLNKTSIQKLVSLIKATMSGSDDSTLWQLCSSYNIEINDSQDTIFDIARKVLALSRAETKIVDFDDMIDFCATGRVPCEQFDILFGDEVQDWNAAQIKMALRSVKESGRIIGVGDRWQSIYGFRGADINAIPGLIKATGAKVLPLSITYRCPSSHVKLAQELVPHIEAREGAAEGTVETVGEFKFQRDVKQGDMVLCRCNAPLVKPAFDLIRQGKKAVILGRDIGKGLLQMVYRVQKKYRVHTLEDTLEQMVVYTRHEVAKLIKRGAELRAQNLEDNAETIYALSDGCETVRELERKIQSVFSDEQEGVTFSSVHKAKGAESERVWILEPGLMPHPKATRPEDVQQERNILYVALTRSKSELYFVKRG